MRYFMVFLLIFSLLFITGTASTSAADYYIEYFDIQTRTTNGGNPTTYIWFQIRDADDFYRGVMKDVVQNLTVTHIDSSGSISPKPYFYSYCHSEHRFSDDNRNGQIEIDLGEGTSYVNSATEYEIISPVSPHAAGNYRLEINCTNGQTISEEIYVEAGMTANNWPPVENVATTMNQETGQLLVSWNLPTSPYPADARIEVRLDAYKKDGDRRYIRFRIRNLLPTLNSFTLSARLADYYNLLGVGFFDVHVRVYMGDSSNMASTSRKEYAIDGYSIAPAKIIAIDEPSTFSSDLKDLYIPFAKYRGNMYWVEMTGIGSPTEYEITNYGSVP